MEGGIKKSLVCTKYAMDTNIEWPPIDANVPIHRHGKQIHLKKHYFKVES